jgi:cell wall-associated NlpC family hydrolase
LFRFLVTGALTVALTGAAFAIGGATETAPTATVTVEAAAPTAGADLAMWGVSASDETATTAGTPERTAGLTGSRLVRRFADGIIHRSTSLAVNLTRDAMRFLGVPYAFGGTSRSGFDCSGYVQHVFAMLGFQIPRTADAQFYAGKRIRGAMVPGDLVFFETYTAGPSHVGIYLGHDRFVHASSSDGVTVSSLHEPYWSARYLGAKRLI